MKLVNHLNSLFKLAFADHKCLIGFGQNVAAGSCLGGLTKGIKEDNPGRIFNTQNSENLLVGIGLGFMLKEMTAVYFVKQHDFLLLAVDQLVNTYNAVRSRQRLGSFTIVPIVVDSGFEGPQSSLNNLSELTSLTRTDIWQCNAAQDSEVIIKRALSTRGMSIVALSQRLMKKDLIKDAPCKISARGRVLQYRKGTDITIVCFNFSLDHGLRLTELLSAVGIEGSLFSVNLVLEDDFEMIMRDLSHSKRLVVLDDSKSYLRFSEHFEKEVFSGMEIELFQKFEMSLEKDWYAPRPDQLEMHYSLITESLRKSICG